MIINGKCKNTHVPHKTLSVVVDLCLLLLPLWESVAASVNYHFFG